MKKNVKLKLKLKPKPTVKKRINVTQRDIDQGEECSGNLCPARAFPKTCMVHVEEETLAIHSGMYDSSPCEKVPTPLCAKQFIQEYDRGPSHAGDAVKPFSFTITIPANSPVL